jgi:DNA polymerase III alpha subunit
MSSYAELHCHSAFSLLDGASTPEALVRRAVELGIVALALTDHDDLGGIVRFSQMARDVGLEAIVGAELTVVASEAEASLSHITLLARTAEGYANLSELVTRARMDEAPAASGKWAPNRGRPRVSWDDLAELGGGLLALTGCPQGELARRVRAGDGKGARELLDYLRGVYDGYVAVEIWDHALPEERELADRLLELADRRRLPAVATNDVHYATPSGRIVHDVLTCLRHRVTLDEAGTRLRPNGEWYLKPPSVVWRRWQRRPDVVENTLAVAAECAFRLADLSPAMPGFQVPSGMTRQSFLESLVWKGAVERYSGAAGQRQNGDPIRVMTSGQDGRGREAPGEPSCFMSRVRSGTEEPPRFMSRGTVGGEGCPRFMSRCVGPESSTGPGAPNVRSWHPPPPPSRGGGSAVPSLRDTASDPRTVSPPRTTGCDQEVAGDPRADHSPLKRGRGRDAAADPSLPTNPRENGKSKLTQDVRRQIRHELEVIERLDLAGYFLTVWDIVRFARRRGILLQGRGSAANSCVCYCLGITAVDPIKFELLFERFLSEERGGAPDIDLDIEHERREEVLQYVYEKYTRGHAAMVCEAITYRGRSAVRDAARVLGFSTDVADGLASEADRREAADAAGALEGGGLTACGLDPSDRRVQALIHVVRGLDQLPRHRSIHVGGFVLTEGELSHVVPIEPAAMKDRTVIQWDKDDLEFAGLIKIDLLGLGMLRRRTR